MLIETQFASLVIDHEQSRAAEITSEPAPPVAENEEGLLAAVTAHLSAVGDVTEVSADVHAAPQIAAAAANASSATRVSERIRFMPPR